MEEHLKLLGLKVRDAVASFEAMSLVWQRRVQDLRNLSTTEIIARLMDVKERALSDSVGMAFENGECKSVASAEANVDYQDTVDVIDEAMRRIVEQAQEIARLRTNDDHH